MISRTGYLNPSRWQKRYRALDLPPEHHVRFWELRENPLQIHAVDMQKYFHTHISPLVSGDYVWCGVGLTFVKLEDANMIRLTLGKIS